MYRIINPAFPKKQERKQRKDRRKMKQTDYIVEVQHLYKVFQTKDSQVEALKDINLQIETGDIYGIIGMSGAGKSTLVRCLNFLEVPTKGEVLVEGQSLAELSDPELRKLRSSISMIFQGFNLLMQKSVMDNVCFPLRMQKMKKEEAKAKARDLLALVGLSDKENAYPAQLSGGQKQRVAIARALASDPRILLCDEATSALDPQTTQQILDLLRKINEETGITIIIITHQMSVVRDICNHVAIIEWERARLEKERHKGEKDLLHEDRRIRIAFTSNSSFEPVIGNMVLHFGTPVNILHADTRDVKGVARGQMILGLPEDKELQEEMISWLISRGLAVEEVDSDVEQ